MKNTSVYIALGANLSNPKQTFQEALQSLEARGVSIVAVSGLWSSPAWPAGSGQPDYTNACAKVAFSGEAKALLDILHNVEAEFGRVRSVKNAARSLDLDLLDFDGATISKPDIELPHPRMLDRAFVILPLLQIAPNWTDPMNGHAITHYLERLPSKDVLPMTYLGAL